MTISGYSNAFVDLMLGWLKGLANWVLRLFNLAGNVGASPLLWLSRNWLKLLIFFLVLGLVLDRLIWLIRWRPYWVWFRKERVIVNDDRFFVNADIDRASDWEGDLESNWDEHDYVVASTVVKRREGRPSRDEGSGKNGEGRRTRQTRGRAEGTRVRRRAEGSHGGADARKQEKARGDSAARPRKKAKPHAGSDNIFNGELGKRDVSDSYEDEVFNVSNLPLSGELESDGRTRRKARGRRR